MAAEAQRVAALGMSTSSRDKRVKGHCWNSDLLISSSYLEFFFFSFPVRFVWLFSTLRCVSKWKRGEERRLCCMRAFQLYESSPQGRFEGIHLQILCIGAEFKKKRDGLWCVSCHSGPVGIQQEMESSATQTTELTINTHQHPVGPGDLIPGALIFGLLSVPFSVLLFFAGLISSCLYLLVYIYIYFKDDLKSLLWGFLHEKTINNLHFFFTHVIERDVVMNLLLPLCCWCIAVYLAELVRNMLREYNTHCWQ